MSVLLAVMSYPKGNEALLRHLPYFQKQEAEWVHIMSTNDDTPEHPEGTHKSLSAHNGYIDGAALPTRMLDTIEELLLLPWTYLILAEHDTVFLKRIRVEAMEHELAAHLAGGSTWGSRAKAYYHNPWVFKREAAINFLKYGREAIREGVCGERSGVSYGNPEASPDVFFGFVTGEHDMPVQDNLWLTPVTAALLRGE